MWRILTGTDGRVYSETLVVVRLWSAKNGRRNEVATQPARLWKQASVLFLMSMYSGEQGATSKYRMRAHSSAYIRVGGRDWSVAPCDTHCLIYKNIYGVSWKIYKNISGVSWSRAVWNYWNEKVPFIHSPRSTLELGQWLANPACLGFPVINGKMHWIVLLEPISRWAVPAEALFAPRLPL